MEPDVHLAGQCLVGNNLRGFNLQNCVLYGTDLRGADLLDATISINCQTFHGVKLDPRQVALLLKLIALADIAPEWKTGIDALVASVTPATAQAIDRFLQIHL